jgi:hypothetical protein
MRKAFICLLLTSVVLTVAFKVNAQVYMYKDDAGKWHGVSSAAQIPEQYRDQVQEVTSPDSKTPEQIKAREAEYANEQKEYKKQLAEKSKKDAQFLKEEEKRKRADALADKKAAEKRKLQDNFNSGLPGSTVR